MDVVIRHLVATSHLVGVQKEAQRVVVPASLGLAPAEVQWTEDLANITGFSLSPSEIQPKSGGSPQNSGQSNHFLLLSGLSGLSLDFAWTTNGIQSCPTNSDELPMDCPLSPLEMAGSDKSPSESIGQAVGV